MAKITRLSEAQRKELLAQVQRPVSGRRAGIDLQACERLLLRAL